MRRKILVASGLIALTAFALWAPSPQRATAATAGSTAKSKSAQTNANASANAPAAATAPVAAVDVPAPSPAIMTPIERPSSNTAAVVQVLDKVTARVKKLSATVDDPIHFGTLEITALDCRKNPPEDRPEAAAFLQIREARKGEESITLFSGWMFASSPAVSALEHPVYDIVVLDCKNPSGAVKVEVEEPSAPANGTAPAEQPAPAQPAPTRIIE
ncbi:MAG: DUF2155 domain-containing protein [Holosporaceae bacterium]|jgi:hypothetical protein